MSTNPNRQIIQNLDDLKKRLDQSKPVVVDKDGRLHRPEDPAVAEKSKQGEVTTVKPSRWY